MGKKRANRCNWLGVALVLILAAASFSCSGVPKSSPDISIANLVFSTSALDFGNVAVNTTKQQSVTLLNSSTTNGGDITITQLSVTGTGFKAAPVSLPLVLAPGQSADLAVVFAPKATGKVDGNLSIEVSGSADPAVVDLAAVAMGTVQLQLTPTTMNFGSVTIGNTKTLNGTLTAGTADVKISSAAWNGQGYSVSGISFPVTIAAQKSVSFKVAFAPQVVGSTPGKISFVSDAPTSPTVAKLAGIGNSSVPSSQHSVTLDWNPSTSGVAGYNIYRGTKSGGPYARLNSDPQPDPNFVDSSVTSGITYYYVATAVDTESLESSFSNEAVAAIPSP